MKALTIQQPWATLIALGEKRFETRSRRTKIRGTIAIHAGKSIDMQALLVPEIRQALLKHGYNDWTKLPYGAVIATAYLYDSFEITESQNNGASSIDKDGNILADFSGNEFKFGWYEVGRYAWELRGANPIEPIAVKGQQGWWNFNYKLEHELLQPGDCVVMHTCLEANHYKDKVWTCESKEFRSASGAYVVFLEGFRGYFATEYLNKIELATS